MHNVIRACVATVQLTSNLVINCDHPFILYQ